MLRSLLEQNNLFTVEKYLRYSFYRNSINRKKGGYLLFELLNESKYDEARDKAFRLFILYGAKLDIRDPDKNTLLLTACSKGYTEIVKFLINKTPEYINTINKSGQSPIVMAVTNGHYESLKLLLKSKADIAIGKNQNRDVLSLWETPEVLKELLLQLSNQEEINNFKKSLIVYNKKIPEEVKELWDKVELKIKLNSELTESITVKKRKI